MIAREWKARCPQDHKEGFIEYLYKTGIKDIVATTGFKGGQILIRKIDKNNEITMISYWESMDAIKTFAGADVTIAKLYPEDQKFGLEADDFVTHYEVLENKWASFKSE